TFLGITASDILNYDLPADELTPQDAKALRDIQTDPRFGDRFWRDEVELMLEIGKKAEQQALAKYGLDYVTDAYLPEKIAQLGLG
ncbi:MAG: DNA topoisomerase VI, partial [Thermoplasmata archaeon]|nr:DNA topoisomerase VI [Thermoplasmata archaeon]